MPEKKMKTGERNTGKTTQPPARLEEVRRRRETTAEIKPSGIASINPATGETLRRFARLGAPEIDGKLQRAAAAFRDYRRMPFAERARMMKRVADFLEGEQAAFGRLMTIEMEKPVKAAIEEAVKCAWACRYYAEHAERLLADEPVETSATRSFVRYRPLGPVLGRHEGRLEGGTNGARRAKVRDLRREGIRVALV